MVASKTLLPPPGPDCCGEWWADEWGRGEGSSLVLDLLLLRSLAPRSRLSWLSCPCPPWPWWWSWLLLDKAKWVVVNPIRWRIQTSKSHRRDDSLYHRIVFISLKLYNRVAKIVGTWMILTVTRERLKRMMCPVVTAGVLSFETTTTSPPDVVDLARRNFAGVALSRPLAAADCFRRGCCSLFCG